METGNETTECQEIENYKRGKCYDLSCLKIFKTCSHDHLPQRSLFSNKIKGLNKITCIFYSIYLKEPNFFGHQAI